MLPSPTELTYFTEVATSLNLSHAAKKLCVTQPTLSLAIKKLEHALGTALFVRHKQGVSLTPAGEKLLEQTTSLLQCWNNTKHVINDSHNNVHGSVTIGCRSVTPIYMKGFLLQLFKQHPQLEVNFKFLTRDEITTSIVNTSIDIGIIVDPIRHGDIVIRKIGEFELSLWTGLSGLPAQDIHSGEAVLICEPNVPQVEKLIDRLKRDNFKIARIITAASLDVVAEFAAEGLGIAIIPPCLAATSYPDKLKPVDGVPASFEDVCLIYRQESKSALAVKILIDALTLLASKWQAKEYVPQAGA